MRWLGRGPHESYPDRYSSARVGLWEGSVGEQTYRYVRPQESGNKLETRWMVLADTAGTSGTLIVAPPAAPLSMSCHHFSLADLDTDAGSNAQRVRHGAELREQPFTAVCVDGAQAGVGGIDSWGSLPLPQHRLSPEEVIEWSFHILPFGEGDPPPRELARRIRFGSVRA